jgi:hypothetical protein
MGVVVIFESHFFQKLQVICASLGMNNVTFDFTEDDFREITSGKVSRFV